MYDNEFETKENKIWTKVKLNHNIYKHQPYTHLFNSLVLWVVQESTKQAAER